MDNSAPAPIVWHPSTGEAFDRLDTLPNELLADVLHALREHSARVKDATRTVEDELRRRMDLYDRRLHTFGQWEVAIESGRESQWDPDELEARLRELIDDGTLNATECVGVIRREVTVDRTAANQLLARLSGSAKAHLEACRRWRSRGVPRVRVTRSIALIPEETAP